MARFHVSDNEFLAQIRRNHKLESVTRAWLAAIQLIGGFFACYLMWKYAPPFIGKPDQQIAIMTGILFGTIFGLIMVASIATIGHYLYFQRMTRLILRYHDELAALKKGPDSPKSAPFGQ